MRKTKISPAHFVSAYYDFLDVDGKWLARVGLPLWAKTLGSNMISVRVGAADFELVDAVTLADARLGGAQRRTNTYIHSDGKRLVELAYATQGSNESFTIQDLQSSKEFKAKLDTFGKFDLFEGTKKVGILNNSDFLFRKAFLNLEVEIPILVQIAIFWGSINKQEIRR